MRVWRRLVRDLVDFLPDPPQTPWLPPLPPLLLPHHGMTPCPCCWAFDLAFFLAPKRYRVRRTVKLLRHSHRKSLRKA